MCTILDREQEAVCRELEDCAEHVLADAAHYSSDTVDYARTCLTCMRRLLSRDAAGEEG